MAEHICDICIHEQACAAWVRHCTALYEDFRYSTDNCPYFQVHCRDCTYYTNDIINKKGFLICPASGMEITEMDFCSYGERKENNNE